MAKVVRPESSGPIKPSPPKRKTLSERAGKGLDLFQPNDHPDIFEDHEHYRRISEVYQALGFYLSAWKLGENDDELEIPSSHMAKIIMIDSERIHRVIDQLPPTSDPGSFRHNWRWKEVSKPILKLMLQTVFKKLSDCI